MKRLVLVVAALLLSSCASTAPESSPATRSMLPQAVTEPQPASTEGAIATSLTVGLHELQSDLQRFYNETLDDLKASLERARVSPPITGPAAPGR